MDYRDDIHMYDPPSKKTAHILVVDDDPLMVNLLKENFIQEGHDVICGFDGQMAIQMAHQHHPDLIVMDVAMPMTNGIKAFEYLRHEVDTRQIPVIFVSGELSKNVYPVIAEAPRVAHLKKPMDLEHLNSVVQQFLNLYPAA